MEITKEAGVCIAKNVIFSGPVNIGFNSCIGNGSNTEAIKIGNNVQIGAFCILSSGCQIGDGVEIDHYCRIGMNSIIGNGSKILYGAQVFDNVKVGKNCIIGGHLIDRTIVEDEVTYSGDMAHLHSDPTCDWDSTEEPSPIIYKGSIIGIGSLIIGGIRIGPRAYISAGEIVKCDVPKESVLINGELKPLSSFHGLIKVRGN